MSLTENAAHQGTASAIDRKYQGSIKISFAQPAKSSASKLHRVPTGLVRKALDSN
jgi:hypothetical protein